MTGKAPTIAVAPGSAPDWMREAVVAGGGRLAHPTAAHGLVWAAHDDPEGLRLVLDTAPNIEWVQLPWAGIEPYVHLLDDQHTWTCGKGVYAEPVAEHALALALAGLRHLPQYAQASTWGQRRGTNLYRARVVILGGGEITKQLLTLLAPFDCRITVVRKHLAPLGGNVQVVGQEKLVPALERADLVVLALALTPETEHIIDRAALDALPDHAWLVNVARGQHIDTDALVDALRADAIGGAALDVTEPEPLPDDHPLWGFDNVLLTPHTANTPEMAIPLLSERIETNVRRFGRGEPLIGSVHVHLGY